MMKSLRGIDLVIGLVVIGPKEPKSDGWRGRVDTFPTKVYACMKWCGFEDVNLYKKEVADEDI